MNFRKCLHIWCVLPYCCNHNSVHVHDMLRFNERQTSDVEYYTTLLFQWKFIRGLSRNFLVDNAIRNCVILFVLVYIFILYHRNNFDENYCSKFTKFNVGTLYTFNRISSRSSSGVYVKLQNGERRSKYQYIWIEIYLVSLYIYYSKKNWHNIFKIRVLWRFYTIARLIYYLPCIVQPVINTVF